MNKDLSLAALLRKEKAIYLDACQENGGTAEGLRQYILAIDKEDPLRFKARATEALMEATTKAWEAQPRKDGDDLFSINGIKIAEHLTRPRSSYLTGLEIEEDAESAYEKVSAQFATVNDYQDDAFIKMRKAAQSSAAAEREMRNVDEARKRAKGKMNVFLRDIAD